MTLPPNYDAAGPFHNGTALHDLQITMKPDDWETLKANYILDTYYPADFQWRNIKVPMIGIRSRGFGSWWDKDSTFYDLNDDIYRGFERTVLGRRILALPALRRMYLESLLDCAATVAQPDAPGSAVSWLEAELLRERAQILAAAQADGNKPYSNERVDEAHQELLQFVRNRSAYVTDLAQRELERLAQGMR